jgi:signal transduction histidine kinase/CheY-like chemotaxis protein
MRPLDKLGAWPLAADVEAEPQRQMIRTALVSAPLSTVGAVLCTLQFRDTPVFEHIKIWLVVYITVTLVRVALALRFMRLTAKSAPSDAQLRAWALRGLSGSMLHGLLWGAMSVVLHAPGSEQAESILHIVLAATVMGTLHLSVAFPVQVAYVACALGALVLRDAFIGGSFHGVMGTMGFFIATYTLINGRSQARALREIAAQRRSNVELVEALRQENTRSEAARRTAEDAVAARTRFFAAANHDLRQPLHAMGLLAHTLQARNAPSHVQEVAEHLTECVDGMAHVIDDLLEITRLDEGGNMAPQYTNFTINALVRECCRPYQAMARAKELQLVLDNHAAIVRSDRSLLARMLSNLVANAIRYTPTGTVRVRCIQHAPLLTLSVEDTGIGIAPHNLPHIFEEFYQVGNPARDRRLGLGLGLATVKRLSELLALDIAVQSTLGQGSVFRLTLPLTAAGADIPAVQLEPPTALALPPARRVLVIEDDADARNALVGLLQSWGCDAQAAPDQAVALDLLRAGFAPEALVADLRLADGASGMDAIHAVRAALGRELPAVIVTGDAGSGHMQAAQAAGLAVMVKPVRAVQLRAFLGQAFSAE